MCLIRSNKGMWLRHARSHSHLLVRSRRSGWARNQNHVAICSRCRIRFRRATRSALRRAAQSRSVAVTHAEVPSAGHKVLDSFLHEFREAVAAYDDEMRKAGLHEPFAANFLILGFASRVWAAARTDQERRQLNLELSFNRAQSVESLLHRVPPGGEYSFQSVGLGGAIKTPQTNAEVPKLLPEEGNQAEIDRIMQEDDAQFARDFPTMTKAERHRRVLANFGPASNNDAVRAVKVLATWAMPVFDWTRPAATAEPVPDECGGDTPRAPKGPGDDKPPPVPPGGEQQPPGGDKRPPKQDDPIS